MDVKTSNFGCSAFTAQTPEGERIFGRNYDYSPTDALVVYTEPKDGKPDLIITAAIRCVLDNCATVDEAAELLYQLCAFPSA